MAIHSSILAWRIPWTEELGGVSKSRTLVTNNLQSTTFTKVTDLWVLLFLFIYCFLLLFLFIYCYLLFIVLYIYCYYLLFIVFFIYCFYLLLLFIYSITIGEGNGNPLQYSCLENPVDRGAWWDAVHRVAESETTEAT